ncbi:MAG TPA: mannitol dehydrogenase family protein, partial [Acidothermaceae bacterium]|nr:mannitol dehydrogenase family protein [Acidothermaceae bacterium]
MTPRLSIAQWDTIPTAARPEVDPRDLTVGIVHLGLGAFHRAHQAVYTERAMAASGETRWGICGVSQRSRSVVDALQPQDGLYTVVERASSNVYRVRAPMRELLFARDPALMPWLAASSTQVVTLTVTEKGYRHDPATRRLNVDDDDVQADAAGQPPTTVVGQLVRGLQARYRGSGAPLTVVSCDNLTANGATLRGLVGDFCALLPHDEGFVSWIAHSISFPSTVVDRIVPATTQVDRSDVARFLGLDDEGAVVTEPFSQWVIEDDFAAARPAWEMAGAIFTDDVAPYEALKLRLLNGSHSALAYLGLLAGYEYVAEFVEVDVAVAYVRALMVETLGSLSVPVGFDVAAYQERLIGRFANPGLRYRLAQIAADGSLKLPLRLVGTITQLRSAGEQPVLSVLAVAAWMRFVSARRDDKGRSLHLDDPLAKRILDALRDSDGAVPASVVDRLLGLHEVFGDLGDDAAVRRLLVAAMEELTRGGALAALRNVT